MKFYYNGKLIRTSKTHVYTHAVITENAGCVACSSTREGAEKVIAGKLSYCDKDIQTSQNMIDALNNGSDGFWDVTLRTKHWVKIDKNYKFHTVESGEKNIQAQKEYREIVKTWKVVELEAK